MARRGTRGTRKNGGKGLFGKVYSPVGHALSATGNSVKAVTSYVGNVSKRSVNGAKNIGNIWTRHANATVRNVFGSRRKSRKSRKGRK